MDRFPFRFVFFKRSQSLNRNGPVSLSIILTLSISHCLIFEKAPPYFSLFLNSREGNILWKKETAGRGAIFRLDGVGKREDLTFWYRVEEVPWAQHERRRRRGRVAYLPAPSLFFLVLLHEWNVIPSDEFRAGFSLSAPFYHQFYTKQQTFKEKTIVPWKYSCRLTWNLRFPSRVVITTSAIHWKQLGHVNQSVCLHQVARPRQILVFVFFGKANNASRKKNRRAKKETLNK